MVESPRKINSIPEIIANPEFSRLLTAIAVKAMAAANIAIKYNSSILICERTERRSRCYSCIIPDSLEYTYRSNDHYDRKYCY